MILGGGPNRIGQGIEFDYCCCHACFALKEAGYETIMINCNPETVSTDYDTSDRLYFEPLTAEDVLEIIDIERSRGTLHGVIVQFGGQTPLKLAEALEQANVPILGTSPDVIDLAEDRDRFKKLLDKLEAAAAAERHRHLAEAKRARLPGDMGYPDRDPAILRAGRTRDGDRARWPAARPLSRPAHRRSRPAVRTRGVRKAPAAARPLSVRRDRGRRRLPIADGKDTFIAGIMEHIEEAGMHSGDSACSLPPHSLDADDDRRTGAADSRAGARARRSAG